MNQDKAIYNCPDIYRCIQNTCSLEDLSGYLLNDEKIKNKVTHFSAPWQKFPCFPSWQTSHIKFP